MTNVCFANPASFTIRSILAFPVKCGTWSLPPLIASTSGSVDQTKCLTPASLAARTAAVACLSSSVPFSRKLVTRKTPCASSNAALRVSGRFKSASTTSSASSRCLPGFRLRARTLNWLLACRARTTPHPCCPVAPITAISFSFVRCICVCLSFVFRSLPPSVFFGEFRPLQNQSGFLKIQPRIAWVELAWVSVAQVAEKIDLPLAVRKEFRIEFVRVKAGHRSAIQPQSARGQDEISSLQRTVAEGGLLNQGLVADKVGAHISLWKELGKILVEFRVPSHDDRDGSGHGFVDIAGGQRRLKECLGARSSQKNESGGRAVGTGRSKARQFVSVAQEFYRHRLRKPRGVGPGYGE